MASQRFERPVRQQHLSTHLTLEKTIGISKLILWENIAVYLFWLYEKELKDYDNSNVADDFRYLVTRSRRFVIWPI